MATACPWGVGAKTSTRLFFESTYGTLPATPVGYVLPINDNSVKSSQNSSDPSTMTGNRNPTEPIYGNVDVSGDITIPVDYVAFGYWLKACFDTPTTTVVTTDSKWKHTYKIGAGMPSFTLEKAFPGITQYFKQMGCKVSKLSLSAGGDGELSATLSIVGKNETLSSTAVSANPTTVTMSRTQNFESAIKIGNTSVAIATSFSIDIDFGLDSDTYCIGGNGMRSAVCDGMVKVSGTVEVFFADNTYINMALNGTETSLELTFTKGDEVLCFKLPEVKFARTGADVSGPTGVKLSLAYNAYYGNDANASAVVVELTNGQEDYNDD